MLRYKKTVKAIALSAALFSSSIALLNYIVDPYWCFGHKIVIGKLQRGFDERQQKTNWLTFQGGDYDTLIFGSSRVTYLDTRDVPGKAYNYSSSSMRPSEFTDYAKHFIAKNKGPVRSIILGLSFFETNGKTKTTFDDPTSYIKRASEAGFRYRSLLSFKLFKESISAIRNDIYNRAINNYDRKGKDLFIKRMPLPVSLSDLSRDIKSQLITYKSGSYGDYEYKDNSDSYDLLNDLVSGAKFNVFITPVTYYLLQLMMSEGRWDDYERWIRDLVKVYGEVWNFMYVNEVTSNVSKYYKDTHHYSPEISAVIVKKLYDLPVSPDFDSFGIKITPQSLEKDLEFLKNNLNSIDIQTSCIAGKK